MRTIIGSISSVTDSYSIKLSSISLSMKKYAITDVLCSPNGVVGSTSSSCLAAAVNTCSSISPHYLAGPSPRKAERRQTFSCRASIEDHSNFFRCMLFAVDA